MNIGLMLSITDRVSDIVWVARQAEALGFESIWVAEHPMIPVKYAHFPNSADDRVPEIYAHWPDPFVSLAAAAAATSRIKLATGICLMPERDPIVTAKVVASLDVLSQGRVILGVGGGALREETEIMGTPFGLRWKRLRENVEAMK
jgi:alkanesulfonate monooxygenase SsuD/methylene tetrahydromethanopterin reductase-like flavin-dependent oxidoreductase (luciferase family)